MGRAAIGLVLAAVVAAVLLRLHAVRGPGATRAADVLRVAAVAAVVVIDALVLPLLLEDRNPLAFTVLHLTVPLLLVLVPLAAGLTRRAVGVATWTCALVLFGLTIVFGLGLGLLYTPAAVLLLLAAVLQSAAPRGDARLAQG
jgi:hypothetical protein